MTIQSRLFLSSPILACAGWFFGPACDSSAQAEAKPPELKVLEKFVGKWKYEYVSKPAAWTPKEVRGAGKTTNEWVLDGRFQQHRSKDVDGTEGIEVLTYDPRQKAFRIWGFFSDGLIKEMTGEWDEKSQTFTAKQNIGNDITVVWKMRFIDNANREGTLVAKDGAGKIYFDGRAKLTRQK